ncbi:hypothetical protein HK102_010059, partial [Quaeritorhiza haematococci]
VSITRSSQPMVGLKQNRSIQDEKLVENIFATGKINAPLTFSTTSLTTTTPNPLALPGELTLLPASSSSSSTPSTSASQQSSSSNSTTVCGVNLIIDARPTANAMAQTALGAGTESVENYKNCKLAYLGIDNIHVIRDTMNKLMEGRQPGTCN